MSIDKIVCVGKNYLEHARELGDTVPEKPVIFLKPASVLKQAKHWHETLELLLPNDCGEIHYECEIVLKLADGGYQMTAKQAASAITEISLGLDMTQRTRQAQLKKNGHPWTIAKVFIDSAVIGPWIPIHEFTHWMETEFTLTVDDSIRQSDYGKNMLVNPVDLLVYISHFFPLCPNDLIFTGTPAGVGKILPGSQATLTWGVHQYSVVWR